jgi:outer membrane protein
MRRALGAIVIACAMMALAAVAQTSRVVAAEAGGSPRELTLEQALAMARQNNRGLTAERVHLEQAKINVDRAWTVLFPTVSAQGKYSRNNRELAFPITIGPADPVTNIAPMSSITIQPLNQLDGVVSFTMPLAVPAAYPALRAVNLNERASQENYASALDNVLFTVAETFHAAAVADEVLVARQSNIDVAKATVGDAKTRFAAGAVTKVDVDRAELALLRAEQAQREAQLARAQTYRALATLIQETGPFRVRPEPSADIPLPPAESNSENFLDTSLHLRPEFRGLEASVQASRAEQSSHAWQWSPSLSAFGNGRIFNYQNFAGDKHAWVIGAQLDWLIYDGGVRDTQRRLSASVSAETAARSEVLRDTIRDDLENGRRQMETKAQARITAERSVDLAKETLDLVRVQYEAGAATQVDLLQAQDNLVAAQDDVARALYDIAIADLTFRRAAGTLPGH